ncbi:hypothetical protein EJB05_48920 [Eragrostis curvula]|uniref:Uncharacterized protein n=1 Tax=Eragrostis curvula TaxID=38414 RepID=A0A5J9T2Z1_9POAL|nr:hypothetical protein EJB05_48920 [Eragrostis curvula]
MKVDVVETTLVAPSEATPRRELWLSNLDLFVPNKHTPLVYYYPAPAPATTDGAAAGEGASFFAPERLKSALAKALVPFYPLAGRLGVGEDGRPQIDCNGEGALFIVARADFTGEEVFQDYRPSPEFRRMFVPFTAPSGELAMFQVTFLKCGGVVLGTGIHHVPIDGIGSFHFIQAWTRLSRGGLDDAAAGDDDQAPAPFHDRTLLRARSPPTPSFDHPVYSLALLTGCPRPSVARVYSVSPALLADLKSRCAPAAASTYCAVAAHLWRCMCVARALGLGSSDGGGVTRLRMTTNARHRLRPPLPRGYSGNAIMRDLVAARVADVLARPLGFTAQAIRDAVDRVDDAYVRSAVDYLEVLDLESSDSENNSNNNNNKEAHGQAGQLMPESDMWLVSWLGMPMYDADFGWGAPRLVAPAQTFGSGTGYVTPRASEDDGVVVIFALEPEYQQCFQKTFYGD